MNIIARVPESLLEEVYLFVDSVFEDGYAKVTYCKGRNILIESSLRISTILNATDAQIRDVHVRLRRIRHYGDAITVEYYKMLRKALLAVRYYIGA